MSKADYSALQMAPVGEDNAGMKEQSTNEDIYCEALAETLHNTVLPVTVGFYAPKGQNKRGLLDKVKKALISRSGGKKDGKGGRGNWIFLLSFIWRVIFYDPVFSPTVKDKKIQYIFIYFDAWDYIGCDHTWAGLVTKLLDEIEKYKILFSIFRAFGGKEPKAEDKKSEDKKSEDKKWVRKRCTKIFFCCFSCVFTSLILGTLLLKEVAKNEAWKKMGYMTILVPVAASGIPFIVVAKNFFFTMKRRLQKNMNRKDLSTQLGFMHSVKREVKNIIDFFRLMELKEDREIRVVLQITNLDLCAPDKVVSILDAINILLCDPKAPFITILAADPSILVECIQCSSNTCSNGYLYLDRIVSLPFSLPQMSREAKSQLLKEILKKGGTIKPCKGAHTESNKKETGSILTDDHKKQISDYLYSEGFDAYFPGNSVQMKRVVNTVLTTWTMIQMGFQPKGRPKKNGKGESEPIEEVIDWVVLANFWPCRLSWILQCVEDDQQQTSLESDSKTHKISGTDKLLKIYDDNTMELDEIKYSIRKLLELDGDPDLFQNFLQKKHFIVEKVKYFSDLLVNLDFSLKRCFELLRGLHGIIRANKKQPPQALMSMDKGRKNFLAHHTNSL